MMRGHRVVQAAGAILAALCLNVEVLADRTPGPLATWGAQQMASRPDTQWTRSIVRLTRPCDDGIRRSLAGLGADVYRNLPVVQSVAVRLPSRNLKRLATLSYVARVSPDCGVRKCDEFTVGSSGAAVACRQYGLTGNGIRVAVLDSGVHAVSDLKDGGSSTIVAKISLVPGDTNPDDKCGHGTHVAGILGGNGVMSTGSKYFRTFLGIAPRADIVNVRVLDQNGQGTVSTVISGIQWVIKNKAKYNIRVMNLSLGHPVGESYTTDPLCQAVEAAYKAGITVVCAAGNSGRASSSQASGAANEGWGTNYGSVQSPANDPFVITVGATKATDANRANDRIATYSSRGPTRLDLVLKPDIVAPGNRVISICVDNSSLDNYAGNTNDIRNNAYVVGGNSDWSKTYFCLSGTSMAAPVVSGAVALMLEKDPTLTPDTIKARLMASADKWTNTDGSYDPCTYGAGYLNLPAALARTEVMPTAATSPKVYRDDQGNVLIDPSTVIWGNGVIWGTGSMSGLTVIWGHNIIWGTTVIWGSGVIWGSSIWTDAVIWGTSTSGVDLTNTALVGEQ